MIEAWFKSVQALLDKVVLLQIVKVMLFCIATIFLLWVGLVLLVLQIDFAGFSLFGYELLNIAGLLSGLSLMGVSWISLVFGWLSFPIMATALMVFFADRFIERTETMHYPLQLPAKPVGFIKTLQSSLAFMGSIILLNLILLPIYAFTMLFFGMGAMLFTLVNGWLIGREYFEMVAIRRLPLTAMKQERRRQGWPLLLFGLIISLLMLIPLFGFLVPILSIITMTHLYHRWQGGFE